MDLYSRYFWSLHIDEDQLSAALQSQVFLTNFFKLFDVRDSGDISQNLLNERLRAWAQPCALDKHEIAEKKIEFVETLEFVMYLICTEEDVTPENFTKIFSNKGSQKQFLKVFGDDKKLVDIETLIAFVMETTNNKEIEA